MIRPAAGVVALLLAWPASALAYPTDAEAQELTRIRRLRWQQDINDGVRGGRELPAGAEWPMKAIELRMLGNADYDIGPGASKDEALQKGLEGIVKKWNWRRFNIAVLDITDPKSPRFAGVNETIAQTPGSTAKVLLGAGLLNALAERYPDDVESRMKFLRETSIEADSWAMPNHHEVPVIYGGDPFAGAEYRSIIRRVKVGDSFSMWEWLDHTLSPSSNAGASIVWREATLMRALGDEYPPAERSRDLYARWDREELTRAAFDAVDDPLIDAGLGTDDFYIRMFFTRGAGRYIKSESSRANPLGLVRWLLRLEQGRMIDEWSSLELKKLLYLTRRRTRYVYSEALRECAVFFKTGSLYKCQPEEGYTCGAYRGNAVNVLNGMVTVEAPSESGPPAAVYIVGVMSNELGRNAASDHAQLAGAIHELVLSLH